MLVRKFATALLATSALSFAGAAYAADVYTPPAEPAYVPAAATPFNWTGIHFGVGVGAQFDFARSSTDGYDYDEFYYGAFASANLGAANWFLTGEVGADYQMGSMVVGIMGNYDWHPSHSSASYHGGGDSYGYYTSVDGRVTWGDAWAIAARFGVLVNPTTLVYGLVGYGQKHISAESGSYNGEDNNTCLIGDGCGISLSRWSGGLIVGAGLEEALSSHTSLKIEYRYARYGGLYGSDSCFAGECGGDEFEQMSVGPTSSHSIRAVFSYHLN